MAKSRSKTNAVGKFVREARMDAPLSMSEFAARMGYNQHQFISHIERGIEKIPIERGLDFAEALELDTDQRRKFFRLLLQEEYPKVYKMAAEAFVVRKTPNRRFVVRVKK